MGETRTRVRWARCANAAITAWMARIVMGVPRLLVHRGAVGGVGIRGSRDIGGGPARRRMGIPVWRALVGLTEIELEGLRYVLAGDRTAVFIDARDLEEFRAQSLPGARNLPRSGLKPAKDVGEVKAAKDDGCLPMEDHNTRIIVFGRDGAQAKAVAEAIAQEAFHNVAYFGGTFESWFNRSPGSSRNPPWHGCRSRAVASEAW